MTPTPLQLLEQVCGEVHERRDGKLLIALSGGLPNYDPRVTVIRAALAARAPLREDIDLLLDRLEDKAKSYRHTADRCDNPDAADFFRSTALQADIDAGLVQSLAERGKQLEDLAKDALRDLRYIYDNFPETGGGFVARETIRKLEAVLK
ncbi:hypothetical protein [Inquilinus limosus]|uniref:Uncharacterized protein n=1 Tax=Inquilinus limosus MP06 TaxID=1398085 RepID=A0A0A0DGN8_9PROT|nr:hypothetical protein [Inquilinus limosus]KGM36167.1 hypothetical protein P409_00535 [Inquilinus limosus MP06]